jgi:hypothetical protein
MMIRASEPPMKCRRSLFGFIQAIDFIYGLQVGG